MPDEAQHSSYWREFGNPQLQFYPEDQPARVAARLAVDALKPTLGRAVDYNQAMDELRRVTERERLDAQASQLLALALVASMAIWQKHGRLPEPDHIVQSMRGMKLGT